MFLSSSIDLGNLPLDVFAIIPLLNKERNKQNSKCRIDNKLSTKARVKQFFTCSTHLVIITSSSSYLNIIILPTLSFFLAYSPYAK